MPAVRYPKEVTAKLDILEKGMLGIVSRASWNGAKNIRADARDSLKLLAPFRVRLNVINRTKADIGMMDQAFRKMKAMKAKKIRHNVATVMSGRKIIRILNGLSCLVRLALVIFTVAEMISLLKLNVDNTRNVTLNPMAKNWKVPLRN